MRKWQGYDGSRNGDKSGHGAVGRNWGRDGRKKWRAALLIGEAAVGDYSLVTESEERLREHERGASRGFFGRTQRRKEGQSY